MSRSIRRRSKPIPSLQQDAIRPGKNQDRRETPIYSYFGRKKQLEGLCANHVLADAAYDSDVIRLRVKRMWAQACIKPKANRKARKQCIKERYRHRNEIERFFGALKRFRRIATRYDMKAAKFAGFPWLASLLTKPF